MLICLSTRLCRDGVRIDERICKCSPKTAVVFLLGWWRRQKFELKHRFEWNIEFYGNEKILFSLELFSSFKCHDFYTNYFLHWVERCGICCVRTKFINLGNCWMSSGRFRMNVKLWKSCCGNGKKKLFTSNNNFSVVLYFVYQLEIDPISDFFSITNDVETLIRWCVMVSLVKWDRKVEQGRVIKN